MSFNSYEFALLRAKRHADKVKQKQVVKEIRHSNDGEKKKLQSSKLGLWLLFSDAFIVQIFCMVMIYRFANESNIGAMIGALLSLLGTIFVQGLSYSIYAKKSTAENTAGGIVFETALREMKAKEFNVDIPGQIDNQMSTDDEEDAVG